MIPRSLKKDYYSWTNYAKDIECLAQEIRKTKRVFKNIFGLPRGGLVPAVSLSHILGKPLLFDIEKVEKQTVIIDDIIDTGRTLERLLKKLHFRPFICSLYYHRTARVKPDLYIHEKKEWVIFPWETIKSSKYDSTI